MTGHWQEIIVFVVVAGAAAYLVIRGIQRVRRRQAGCCDVGCAGVRASSDANGTRFVPMDQVRVSAGSSESDGKG